MSARAKYICPVCGFDGLEKKPYENMPVIAPALYEMNPPYEDHWGLPSYEVCSCCGFEFGNDDNSMDPRENSSFSSWLKTWALDEGARWFWPEEKPEGWRLVEQLDRAEIPVSIEIRAAIERL